MFKIISLGKNLCVIWWKDLQWCLNTVPNKVIIKEVGEKQFKQQVEMPKLPEFCRYCKALGHNLYHCRGLKVAIQPASAASSPDNGSQESSKTQQQAKYFGGRRKQQNGAEQVGDIGNDKADNLQRQEQANNESDHSNWAVNGSDGNSAKGNQASHGKNSFVSKVPTQTQVLQTRNAFAAPDGVNENLDNDKMGTKNQGRSSGTEITLVKETQFGSGNELVLGNELNIADEAPKENSAVGIAQQNSNDLNKGKESVGVERRPTSIPRLQKLGEQHSSGHQLLVTMIGPNPSARSTSMLPNLGVLDEQFISKLRPDDRAGNSFQKLTQFNKCELQVYY